MSALLDRYLILSEEGFAALASQAHSTREEAEKAAIEWHKNSGSKIIIFHKLITVESATGKVRHSDDP